MMREIKLLVRGGTVPNASGTQTSFSWADQRSIPSLAELERRPDVLEARREILAQLRKIKTVRRSRARANHARARAELEERGARFMRDGYESDAKQRPCALRVFYRSMDGEVLVCESEPMTYIGVQNAIAAARVMFDWALAVECVPACPLSMHGIERCELPPNVRNMIAGPKATGAQIRKTPTHGRFVVFPSQRLEPVEVTDFSELHDHEVNQTLAI